MPETRALTTEADPVKRAAEEDPADLVKEDNNITSDHTKSLSSQALFYS